FPHLLLRIMDGDANPRGQLHHVLEKLLVKARQIGFNYNFFAKVCRLQMVLVHKSEFELDSKRQRLAFSENQLVVNLAQLFSLHAVLLFCLKDAFKPVNNGHESSPTMLTEYNRK